MPAVSHCGVAAQSELFRLSSVSYRTVGPVCEFLPKTQDKNELSRHFNNLRKRSDSSKK